jgi:hypothetical protein
MELIKIQLQMKDVSGIATSHPRQALFSSTWGCINDIRRKHGILGLCKDLAFRVSCVLIQSRSRVDCTGIQRRFFLSWKWFFSWLKASCSKVLALASTLVPTSFLFEPCPPMVRELELPPGHIFCVAALGECHCWGVWIARTWHFVSSGMLIWSVVFPIDLVKSRYQYYLTTASAKLTYKDIISETYAKRGLGGFYNGIQPCLLRAFPVHSVIFLTYSHMENLIQRLWRKS